MKGDIFFIIYMVIGSVILVTIDIGDGKWGLTDTLLCFILAQLNAMEK